MENRLLFSLIFARILVLTLMEFILLFFHRNWKIFHYFFRLVLNYFMSKNFLKQKEKPSVFPYSIQRYFQYCIYSLFFHYVMNKIYENENSLVFHRNQKGFHIAFTKSFKTIANQYVQTIISSIVKVCNIISFQI